VLERNGGDDGARTRGLCRDSERSTCMNSLLLPVNVPAGAKADFRLVRHSGETPAVIL
jgi:hypothetical protein